MQGCFCAPSEHRFVMIEDLTNPASGDSPGADIDAVSVLKSGEEFFATQVEDASVDSPTNRFNDPSELLGPSDSGCMVQNFTSLGGRQFGGFAIVSFDGGGQEVAIENGDVVKVYEVGNLLCGRFDDDPYQVSVSISTDQGTFVELGDGGSNRNLIPVTGL